MTTKQERWIQTSVGVGTILFIVGAFVYLALR